MTNAAAQGGRVFIHNHRVFAGFHARFPRAAE
jgi:hypothetical protein